MTSGGLRFLFAWGCLTSSGRTPLGAGGGGGLAFGLTFVFPFFFAANQECPVDSAQVVAVGGGPGGGRPGAGGAGGTSTGTGTRSVGETMSD